MQTTIRQKSSFSKSNITKEWYLTLKRLQCNIYIVALPADKGNTMVIMDKSGYLTDIIKEASYKLNQLQQL